MERVAPRAGARPSAPTSHFRGPWSKALAACTLGGALLLGGAPGAGAAPPLRDADWIGTWTASPSNANENGFSNQTVRLIVHTSIGGPKVRVKLSNTWGTQAVTVGDASIALQAQGANIVSGSSRPLTFGGAASVVIPRGATVVSDAVPMAVPPLSNLAVSLYLPGSTGPISQHALAVQSNYASPSGNYTDAVVMPVQQTRTSWSLLSAVEVGTGETAGPPTPGSVHVHRGAPWAVVTMGDSITDGYGATVNANRRWPDVLARRLQARQMNVAVLNQGISGNRVLHDALVSDFGENALARFDRDVLSHPRVRWLVLLEGINDLGQAAEGSAESVTANDVIQAYKQIILRAREHGIKVYGGTLTPYRGTIFPGYFQEAGELKRMAINQWIRTSGWFDAVIDFDAAVRNPADPSRILPIYDVGDRLHPNDAGYRAMGEAVDLGLFTTTDTTATTGGGTAAAAAARQAAH